MEYQSFVNLLDSDIDTTSDSSDETNTSIFSTSIDSGIASSFDSNISSSFSLSPQRHVTNCPKSSSLHVVIARNNHPSLENCPPEFVQYPPQITMATSFPPHDSGFKQQEQQSSAIMLTTSNVETMKNYSDFDRYTRSTFSDMEAKRHHDLAAEYIDIKELLPSYRNDIELQTMKYLDALDNYPSMEGIPDLEVIQSVIQHDWEPENRIIDITEYTVPKTSVELNLDMETTTSKKKKNSVKDTAHDKRKYKRRKELSYENVVTVSSGIISGTSFQ